MTNYDVPVEALPNWMQRTLRGPDWGVLISLAFSLIAAWSFVIQPGLPGGGTAEAHVYRAAEYAEAIREGRLYPRWSAAANGGYGAPIPNYTPPSAAYLPALIDTLLLDNPVIAVRLTFTGALIIAGAAAYAFVRRRFGALSGVIASMLYLYSPYVGLTTPYINGDLPAALSHALLPLLLLSTDRLLRDEQPLDFLSTALITGGAVLTEPRAAALAIGITLLFTLWHRLTTPTTRWRALLTALILGVGISACFWLPALLEADAVTWQSAASARPILRWFDLLALPRALDPAALIPQPQHGLGLPLIVCALAALPIIIIRRDGLRGLFLIIAVMTTSIALSDDRVWLLGGAVFAWAVVGSGVTEWAQPLRIPPRVIGLGALIGILVMAFPLWMLPERPSAPTDTSLNAQITAYQAGFGVVSLPPGTALPTTLNSVPTITLPAGLTPLTERVAPTRSAQIGLLSADGHGFRAQVQTSGTAMITLLLADFPGWRVRFSGSGASVSTNNNGLITVTFSSAARGELTVSLEPTTPRLLAWALTWGSLLVTVGITLVRTRALHPADDTLDLLSVPEARLFATLATGCAALMVALTIPGGLGSPTAPPGYGIGGFALDTRSDTGLETLAFDIDRIRAAPGEDLYLSLYWQTLRFLSINYRARLSLLDLRTGDIYRLIDYRHPAHFPTGRWLPRRYIRDSYRLTLPTTLQPGEYSPAVEVFNCSNECAPNADRISFFDTRGNAYGQVLVLPVVITVTG